MGDPVVSPSLVTPEIVLPPSILDEIEIMFRVQDKDGDGRIDAAELADVWKDALRKGASRHRYISNLTILAYLSGRSIDAGLMASEVARTLDIMDIDGDGTVDLEEFKHAMLVNGSSLTWGKC